MRIAITDRAHTFHLFSKDYPLFLKLVFFAGLYDSRYTNKIIFTSHVYEITHYVYLNCNTHPSLNIHISLDLHSFLHCMK